MPKKEWAGPSEHEIQSQILEWLKIKRIFHHRQNTGGAKLKGFYVKFGTPGAPDIVAVIRGRYVGIEVKANAGIQSRHQFEFQTNLEAAGGKYLLVRSLQEVIKGLES